jgi:hypothetical protein
LTHSPEEEDTQEAADVRFKVAAEALEKSKLMASFAIAPATQKPKLASLISKVSDAKSAKNLESRFKEEDDDSDKEELSFEFLEAPTRKDDVKIERDGPLFTPSVAQWNSLIHRVETLTQELASTREAVAVVAEASEDRMDVIAGQVVHLRGSVGSRPFQQGPNLPALNLWTNVHKMADDVADVRKLLVRPQPSNYKTHARSLIDSTQMIVKKQAGALTSLDTSKAGHDFGFAQPVRIAQ